MPLLTKVGKVFSPVKTSFTRRSTVVSPADQPLGYQTNAASPPALEPSQSLTAAAHDPTPVTEDQQLALVLSPTETASARAITASDVDGQAALVADDENESRLSRGFAAFKRALEVTKELAEPFPPLKYAVTCLLVAMEGFENVNEVQEDFAYVARKLTFMRITCDEHRSQIEASKGIKASMDSLARAMRIVEEMVKAKSDRGLFKRIWENPSDVKAVADALRMLGDVADQFIMSVTVSTHSMLFEGLQDQVVDKLAFVESAQFLSIENGRLCADGTRAEFLADLLVWAMAADQPRICWVNGAAGSGKTTIAYTVCSFLRGLGLLGGSFFCSRDADDKRRSTKFIFTTLARYLAHQDGAYARSLAEVLREPGAGGVIASEQFTSLIVGPIRSAHPSGDSSAIPIRVLVIDALDECGDDDKTVYNLVRAMLAESRGLRLKFLITTRLESHIIRAFENAEQDSYSVRRVQDIPDDVAKVDIRTYLESELKECARSCGIGNGWPPASQVRALAQQAGTLFIYASTACKYIWNFDDDPEDRLTTLTAVHAEPLRGIDPMYEFVLDKARQSKTDRVWDNTRRCVQAIACLSHPLSLNDLADLLDIQTRDVRIALAGLRAVLSIPSSDSSGAITVFHASFPDYILDANRSRGKGWFLESPSVHRDLLLRCIAIMKSVLCFNISNSSTSYVLNEKQPIKPPLSRALRYSCVYWIDHLEGCRSLASSELAELSELLMERFLHWLEVLSITGEVHRAPIAMARLLNWLYAHAALTVASDELCQTGNQCMSGQDASPHDLRQFARDARDFVTRFSRPIQESCPHIYLSALATTMRSSTIWTKISPMFQRLPSVLTQQAQDVCPVFILRGHESLIRSVAFSPDGTRVVSGSDDQTVRLWDAITGAAIGDPLRGHEDNINSVAFLPDGRRVVSGSSDGTIRLWDVALGEAIGDPLRGHQGGVYSVAISPDGTRLVSGSVDRTIQMWDAATGAAIGEPLRGHRLWVRSVTFSPDGTRIASSSLDFTVRLWDVATAAAVGDPLRGHEGDVLSVAFSPDGSQIVSASRDRTFRLWDVATAASIGGPVRVHDGYITSLAFSPDGACIASGSTNHVIRLWDAHTVTAIGNPLRGHEGYISSVAFSSDGKRIVSGSGDRTIGLWNAATEIAMGDSVRAHEGGIRSVAFSLDGTKVISGSGDCTIRLWDAATGAALGNPLRGHNGGVESVAFSPDGTRAVSSSIDCTIRLWDVAKGVAIGNPLRGHEGYVSSVTFSPDGTRVISGSFDRTIRLWDADTGKEISEPLRGHEHWVQSVAYSPDGKRFVSGSSDHTVRLWDAATRAAVGDPFRGHESDVGSVAFSHDGTRIVSGSNDGSIRMWDAATGAPLGDPIRCNLGNINSVAFSPDGKCIVSGSASSYIRLWDVATGAAIDTIFRGHDGYISSVAFSPEGTRVISGSADCTIRLWDASTGATIGEPVRECEDSATSVACLPTQKSEVSTYPDSTSRHWDTASQIPVDAAIQNLHDSGDTNMHYHPNPGAPNEAGHDYTVHHVLTSGHLSGAAFSPLSAHAVDIGALLSPQPHRDPRDAFVLHTDGWLRGPGDELILWILPEYRRGLWWPRTAAIMGAHPVMLDLSQFVHGEDWTQCWQRG